MVALAHGTNDAQKTMGVICLALIANGSLKGGAGFEVPDLGRRELRDGDRLGHLHRRLAHHQDPRHEGRRGPPAPRLRVRDRRRLGDPRLLARRLPALHHPGRLRRGRRLRASVARARSSTGSSRATSSSAGCSRCLPPPLVAASTAIIELFGGGASARSSSASRCSSPRSCSGARTAPSRRARRDGLREPRFRPGRAHPSRRRRDPSVSPVEWDKLLEAALRVRGLRDRRDPGCRGRRGRLAGWAGPPQGPSGRRDGLRRGDRLVRAGVSPLPIALGIYIMTDK